MSVYILICIAVYIPSKYTLIKMVRAQYVNERFRSSQDKHRFP